MKYNNNNNNNVKSINSFSQKSILFYFITPIISVSLITILIFQYKNIIKKLKKNNEEKIEDADNKITDTKNKYIEIQRLQLHNSRLYNYYKLLGLGLDDINKFDPKNIIYISIECIFKLFNYRSFLIEYIIDMEIYHTSDLLHDFEEENAGGSEGIIPSSSIRTGERTDSNSSSSRISINPRMVIFNKKIGENEVQFLIRKELDYNNSGKILDKIENMKEFNINLEGLYEFFTFYFEIISY